MQQPQQPGKILRWVKASERLPEPDIQVFTQSGDYKEICDRYRLMHRLRDGEMDIEWGEDLSAPASPVKSQLFLGDKLPAHLRKDMDKHSARWKALGWPPMSWEEGAEWMYWRAVMKVNKEPDLLELDEPSPVVGDNPEEMEDLPDDVREDIYRSAQESAYYGGYDLNSCIHAASWMWRVKQKEIDKLTESKPSPVIEIGEMGETADWFKRWSMQWLHKMECQGVDPAVREAFKIELEWAYNRIAKDSHNGKNQDNA